MADKYLKLEQLTRYNNKLKETYAAKGDLPAAATTAKAGVVKPDGKTITVEDDGTIKAKQQDLSTYALKSELPAVATTEKAGTVKPDGTTVTVTEEGVIAAKQPDLSGYVEDADIEDMLTKTEAGTTYLTQASAGETYATKSEAATKTELQSYATKEEAATKAELGDYAKKSDVSSAYKAKGSVSSEDLEGLNVEANLGNVYNVSDALTTTEDFVDGAGHAYPAGTNVVVVAGDPEDYKFDVLAGFIDLGSFVAKSDMVAITDGEIDALFAPGA